MEIGLRRKPGWLPSTVQHSQVRVHLSAAKRSRAWITHGLLKTPALGVPGNPGALLTNCAFFAFKGGIAASLSTASTKIGPPGVQNRVSVDQVLPLIHCARSTRQDCCTANPSRTEFFVDNSGVWRRPDLLRLPLGRFFCPRRADVHRREGSLRSKLRAALWISTKERGCAQRVDRTGTNTDFDGDPKSCSTFVHIANRTAAHAKTAASF